MTCRISWAPNKYSYYPTQLRTTIMQYPNHSKGQMLVGDGNFQNGVVMSSLQKRFDTYYAIRNQIKVQVVHSYEAVLSLVL